MLFVAEMMAAPAFDIKRWQSGRHLRQAEKKLSKRVGFIQSQSRDCFDSLLCIYNYNFQDTTLETHQLLTGIQSDMQSFVAENRHDTALSEAACLLLAKTFFYQGDFENAQRYLQYSLSNPKSSRFAENLLWKLRTETALHHWNEAENILTQLSYMKEEGDTLSATALEYALLETDLQLHKGDLYGFPARLQYLAAQPLLSPTLRQRLCFILGQCHQMQHREREAVACYSRLIDELSSSQASPSALFAYAYVNRDDCYRQLERQRQDSLRWISLFADNDLFEPTMVESTHDSDYIYSLYPYYFQDLASRYFLDEEIGMEEEGEEDPIWYYDDNDTSFITEEMRQALFENWDSVSIHIPKADFSHLEDTICLPLVDSGYVLPLYGEVSSEFGWRRYRYHYGFDIRKKTGDSIYCLFDGYVRIAKRNRTYGNLIVVRHLNGLETFYAHCSKLLVEQNQEVKAGQLIALAGSTGRSTGPHLHLEVRYRGVPFNPRHIFNMDSNCLYSDTLKITKETFNYLRPGRSSSGGSSSSSAVYYKVKSGDTLSRIALKYHTSVAALKRLNGLRSDFIREGQRLRVL